MNYLKNLVKKKSSSSNEATQDRMKSENDKYYETHLPVTIVIQTSKIFFYDHHLNQMGVRELPKNYRYDDTLWQSKDCQVSETEYAIGEQHGGKVFVINFFEDRPSNEVVKVLKGKHCEDIYFLQSTYQKNRRFPKSLLISTGSDSIMGIWDVENSSNIHVFRDFTDWVINSDLYKDCSKVLSSCWDGALRIHCLRTMKCLKTIGKPEKNSKLLNFVTNVEEHHMLLSVSKVGLECFDDRTYKLCQTHSAKDKTTYEYLTMHYIDDLDYLIIGDNGGYSHLFDIRKLDKNIWSVRPGNQSIERIVENQGFKGSGERIVVQAGEDGFIRNLRLRDGKVINEVKPGSDRLYGVFNFLLRKGEDENLKDLWERKEFMFDMENINEKADKISLKIGDISKFSVLKFLL